MDRSTYTEEKQRRHEAALLDVGNKLAKAPSSVDELLTLLTRAELLLSHVFQICGCHETIRGILVAMSPAKQALISDKIFKHPNLDIKVAVASCINEIIRITIAELDYPFTDDQMKEIFQLYIVSFEQLSCESGENYERALRIIENVAKIRSYLILLDLEVETGSVVVEMFQVFLNTIRLNHSSDIFDHMKNIMISIIEESDDISMDLLRPLLSSVKMDNKDTSPRSWELGKYVIEKCALRLQNQIRKAVKEGNLMFADYADIVASFCQDTTSLGNDTVAIEIDEVARVKAANEESEETTNVQLANEEVKTVHFGATLASSDGACKMNEMVGNEEVEIVQETNEEVESIWVANDEVSAAHFETTATKGDEVSKLTEKSEAGPEIQILVERSRRGIKPNSLMRPEEGYQYTWSAGCGSKSAEDSSLPTELKNVKMPSDSSQEETESIKKESVARRGQSRKQVGMTSQDKTLDVLLKSTKEILQNKVKEKSCDNQNSKTEGVKLGSGSGTVEIEKENELGDILDKVVESAMPKPTKAKQFKKEGKVQKKGKNTTKGVGIEKANDSQGNGNTISARKYESGDLEKVKVKGPDKGKKITKCPDKGKKITKCLVVQSNTNGIEKEDVSNSAASSEAKKENENTSGKHESANVAEKLLKSRSSKHSRTKQFKVEKKDSKKRKRTSKTGILLSTPVSLEKENASHSVSDPKRNDGKEISSQRLESRDVKNKVESLMPKQLEVKEKASKKRKKTMESLVVLTDTIGAEKGRVEDGNEITPNTHESDDVGKVEPVTAKPSKVQKNGPNKKGKKTSKGASAVCLWKEKVTHNKVDPEGEHDNEVDCQFHESGDEVDKIVESSKSNSAKAKQSEVKEKGSRKQKKRTKRGFQSNTIDAEKEKVSHTSDDLVGKKENEIALQNYEVADVVEKVVESSMPKPTESKLSKVKRKGSSKQKKRMKSVAVQLNALGAENENVGKSDAEPERKEDDVSSSQKHEKYESADVAEELVENSMSKPTKSKNPRDVHSEKEEEPINFRPEYGQELVNLRIMIWWPLDETFYTGTVESYDPLTKKHKIKYDDDEEEILDMSVERWEMFKEIQSRPAHSSAENKTGLSPPAKEPGNSQKKAKKRKAGLLKKDHTGSSSKRSKKEGNSAIKSVNSPIGSTDAGDESDDETREGKISWKTRAIIRAGKKGSETSRRKGRPRRGAPNDAVKTLF